MKKDNRARTPSSSVGWKKLKHSTHTHTHTHKQSNTEKCTPLSLTAWAAGRLGGRIESNKGSRKRLRMKSCGCDDEIHNTGQNVLEPCVIFESKITKALMSTWQHFTNSGHTKNGTQTLCLFLHRFQYAMLFLSFCHI